MHTPVRRKPLLTACALALPPLAAAGAALAGNGGIAPVEPRSPNAGEGRNAMPAVGAAWSDSQMEALTGYLKERFGSGG